MRGLRWLWFLCAGVGVMIVSALLWIGFWRLVVILADVLGVA